MTTITPIPALKDNYIWMIANPQTKSAIVVDPGEAEPVIAALKKQQLQLSGIFATHHHWDHVNGITKLLDLAPVPVYGPLLETVPHCNNPLQNGDRLHLPTLDAEFRILDIPGHTLGHIAYVGLGGVFCGDTLFTGGCGRNFEGTPEQLLNSLHELMKLAPETLIYCGHEYTEKNLHFAIQVDPHNLKLQERLKQAQKMRSQAQPTVPASLKTELETNPFLRCGTSSVRDAVNTHCKRELKDEIEVFAELRAWKNQF